LVDTFKHVFKVRSSERNPTEVSKEQGWSPYQAKDFLIGKGVITGFYNRLSEDEWTALSPMNEFSDGIIPDNIAYYIEGSEDVVNVLKLKVNVNDATRSQQASAVLMEMAEALYISSLSQQLSKEMKRAISSCEPYSEKLEDKTVSLTVEHWPDHRFNGYDLKFIISSV
jgi:redox-regulated HSP33 family molecular chaperone